ncbi:MAG: PIG-L deacetylase family protein [bacterium]
MYKIISLTIFVFASYFSFNSPALPEEIKPISPITQTDRILILAPHPDDESIGTAGIIQEAVKVGAQCKIVCFTNGDHNQWAFIVDTKHIPLRQKEFIRLGEERRQESIAAMAYFGIRRTNLIFLGYPDFGTLKMFTDYWDTPKPFRGFLTRIDKVPYPEALSPGTPYVSESILKDLKTILSKYQPTKIFVSHPADTNRDHRALYLYLRVALWDLEKSIPRPELYPYLIHMPGWPYRIGPRPELILEPPTNLPEVIWQRFILSPEQLIRKRAAISIYKTQFRSHLYPFARKNELFGDYPIIKLHQQPLPVTDWQKLALVIDTTQYEIENGLIQQKKISALAYAEHNGNVVIKINLQKILDETLGISIYLFGYKSQTAFSKMPKIRIALDLLGIKVFNMSQRIQASNIQFSSDKQNIFVTVPISILDNPKYILTSAYSRTGDLPIDETAWRILELN